MLPYPFNYFSSIYGFKKPFTNRKLLTWFQLIFTSIFLISLSMIPVAIQNASLKTYPLTTFVDGVFNPLTKETMDDITKNAKIENQLFSYSGQQPAHNSKAGTVLLGQEQTALGEKLTLAFEPKQLIISKKGRKLANIQYQHINQVALKDKATLSAAISQDWFQQNRITVSLFLILISGFLLALNFFIVLLGATFFLYLTKKSRLFSFKTVKECYHFALNCLGLPTLIAVAAGLLFGQAMTTMITIQNILFVLYLVIIFYRTHFRDEKMKK
ncbi:Uncharacterised protein [Streptococcus constellatus]|uniref:Maltodextrose utilization protein MalA n=1 Tax=Streptococcus constellatus TaxID=76860 RepID=A0A564T2W1_STRCV|nr:DUF1189 domain-containing protein [Streptococcus constellatus]VUX01767.1 Uncharacterised protein [Streptococcus constellatus]VUX03857.1 Uncharacterised protein [Streptococcus gordonii]